MTAARFPGWARITAGVLLLACAVGIVARDPAPLAALLTVGAPTWLALIGLASLNNLLMAARLRMALSENTELTARFVSWVRIVVIGQFLNLIIPQLGNVYRARILKREHGLPYAHYARGLVAFVWLDTVFSLALCSLLVMVLTPDLTLHDIPVGLAVGLGTVAVVVVPLTAARVLRRVQPGDTRIERARAFANHLLDGMHQFVQSPARVAGYAGWSLLVTAEQVASLWLCFRVVGVDLSVSLAAVFQILTKLSGQLIVIPGNLGLMELGFGVLSSGADNVTASNGVAAALVFRATFTLLVVVQALAIGGLGAFRDARQESPTA